MNADSHLAFIAGGLRTCVSYRNRAADYLSSPLPLNSSSAFANSTLKLVSEP
jgi:hypothetical protein